MTSPPVSIGPTRGGVGKVVTDTITVLVRELRPTLRDPFSPIIAMGQPLVFLGLFGTSATGANLLYEMQTGSHERLLVTPLSRSALLVGRALKEMVPLLAQAVLVIGVMVPFGFRLYPVGALPGLLILAVFGVGVGALSYSLALAVRRHEWLFWGVQQTLLFPLVVLAGMMLPLDGGPAWMRVVSQVNPLTHVVDAERALFAGDLAHPSVVYGTVGALVLAVVGLFVGTRIVRRAE